MDKTAIAKTITAAKAVFLLDKEALCLIDAQEHVYRFNKGDNAWHYDETLQEMFRSPALFAHLIPLSREQALDICLNWLQTAPAANTLLEDAIVYAVSHHAGGCRKGTKRPYIFHPLETMLILQTMNADTDLLIAGVLHDTVEDTDATLSDIQTHFGEDVARLVAAHSEDKRLSWRERKEHAINTLAHADRRLCMLVLADKVSNLREMNRDYAKIGDTLWERFNAGADMQAWYYSGIQDALFALQNDADCAEVYWEMVALYKDLFVHFYLDPNTPALYQTCRDGSAYRLEKGNPEWQRVSLSAITCEPLRITRKEAEALEDQWNTPFWASHKNDLADAAYLIQESARHTIELHLRAQTLTLLVAERPAQGAPLFTYTLDEEATHRFLARLRIEYDTEESLPTLLAKLFDTTDAITCFTNFCQRNDIPWTFTLA